MAHFAEIDENNVVIQVIVVDNSELLDEDGIEQEQKGIDFCFNLLGGTWVQTSYNATIRKHYAGIGYSYDPTIDAFCPPQPYPSWVLDEDAIWQAPIEYPTDGNPTDGKFYYWDEETINWIEIPTE